VPPHPVVARDDVGGHVIAPVAYAQAVAGGVGKEVEAVEGLPVVWVGRAVEVGLGPAFLPLGFDGLRIVGFYLVSPIFYTSLLDVRSFFKQFLEFITPICAGFQILNHHMWISRKCL
jgi:hypothetical protein